MIIAHTDGATWKTNPGPAGAGVVFTSPQGIVLHTICEPLGWATSNDAEWLALILAVEWFVTESEIGRLHVRSDSQLIVNQAQKNWVINKSNLVEHAKRFFYLKKVAKKMGRKITIEWIRREENGHADTISKAAAELASDIVGIGPPEA